VVTEGIVGRVDEDGNVLVKKIDQVVEYGPAELPFDTIRRPNLDLASGEEFVVTEGIVGRVDEDGNVLVEKVDKVIEYGPEQTLSDPNSPSDPAEPSQPEDPSEPSQPSNSSKEESKAKLPLTGEQNYQIEAIASLLMVVGLLILPILKRIKRFND
ncbi:hypothetical protein ACQV18_09420, partial [Facklamia sp. P9177]